MHIAVVIPAFNVAAFLSNAIVSLFDQTHQDWSLVVVDDGSTDATAAVAAQFRDSRVRLIRQPHVGVSAARNAGLAALWDGGTAAERLAVDTFSERRGGARQIPERAPLGPAPDAFLFLDGDDWLAPSAMTQLAETLEDAPSAVAAVGRYARVGPNAAAHLSPPPPQGRLLERLLTRNLFVNGGHLLIRREAIEAAGDFRTDLYYGEDWGSWTRLAAQGAFVSVPSCSPLLFVRERLGGAYLSRAADPAAYRPALNAIYHNPGLAVRVGPARLAALRRRAEAEMAWTVGRELVRRGRRQEGLRWLGRSIRAFPSPKRLVLAGLSWLGVGPFRRYRIAT